MVSKIAGRVRGLFAGNYPENREDEQFHLNNRGDQLIVQGLPELTEIVRLGDTWQVKTTTGLASLTGLPTTVGGLSLWNGEPTIGKCYIIDSVAVDQRIVDATQSDIKALYCMMNKYPTAIPTDAALAIASMIGKTYGGRARTLAGGTVVNDGWFPCGNSVMGAVSAVAGASWKVIDQPIRGLYIIPPGGMFSINSVQVGPAAANDFFTIRWHEAQIIWKS